MFKHDDEIEQAESRNRLTQRSFWTTRETSEHTTYALCPSQIRLKTLGCVLAYEIFTSLIRNYDLPFLCTLRLVFHSFDWSGFVSEMHIIDENASHIMCAISEMCMQWKLNAFNDDKSDVDWKTPQHSMHLMSDESHTSEHTRMYIFNLACRAYQARYGYTTAAAATTKSIRSKLILCDIVFIGCTVSSTHSPTEYYTNIIFRVDWNLLDAWLDESHYMNTEYTVCVCDSECECNANVYSTTEHSSSVYHSSFTLGWYFIIVVWNAAAAATLQNYYDEFSRRAN